MRNYHAAEREQQSLVPVWHTSTHGQWSLTKPFNYWTFGWQVATQLRSSRLIATIVKEVHGAFISIIISYWKNLQFKISFERQDPVDLSALKVA